MVIRAQLKNLKNYWKILKLFFWVQKIICQFPLNYKVIFLCIIGPGDTLTTSRTLGMNGVILTSVRGINGTKYLQSSPDRLYSIDDIIPQCRWLGCGCWCVEAYVVYDITSGVWYDILINQALITCFLDQCDMWGTWSAYCHTCHIDLTQILMNSSHYVSACMCVCVCVWNFDIFITFSAILRLKWDQL